MFQFTSVIKNYFTFLSRLFFRSCFFFTAAHLSAPFLVSRQEAARSFWSVITRSGGIRFQTPNRSFVTNSRRNSEDSSSADDSRELKVRPEGRQEVGCEMCDCKRYPSAAVYDVCPLRKELFASDDVYPL